MKRLLICIASILLYPGILFAGNTAPSDRELFEELYSQGLRALVPEASPGTPVQLLTVYAGVIPPSEHTRSLTEAVLSELGYSLADSARESSRTLTIWITDARCTVTKQGKTLDRLLSLTLHARCTDLSGSVIFAHGCDRTAHDRISRTLRKSTDTGSGFSPGLKRIVLESRPNYARIASLITLSAALGYFAFQK